MKKLACLFCMAVIFSGYALAANGEHPARGEPGAEAQGYGPPPHAPAHGYRHKHRHGVDLSFDTNIGAYQVVGYPGIYFSNDLYLRRHPRGHWLSSGHYSGPWKKSGGKGCACTT